MKILVCISRTPDTTAKIAFGDNNTKFVTDGVQWIINPYDEWYALVRAIMLKERDASTTIHLITVGGADVEPIIRKALALGGDEAFRVDMEPMDSYQVAVQIAQIAREGQYDLILTGKETIDSNGSAVGAMVAELLDMDMVSLATALEFEGSSAIVTREIEGGEEVAEIPLPLVISCQKGMAEARIPNMRGIMAARTKPLKVVPPVEVAPLTGLVSYTLPPARSGVRLVPADQPEELVRLLHEEARII
ncbi:MAG: electron transfer flavoprotein subunit beta/FixA family protein [Chitinophagaceae bacterium]|nr:electron transfer flavoprotein subunit beta/FixA family protein [Chitinophagaceae bacterium]